MRQKCKILYEKQTKAKRGRGSSGREPAMRSQVQSSIVQKGGGRDKRNRGRDRQRKEGRRIRKRERERKRVRNK
jgi:hypothetical protein